MKIACIDKTAAGRDYLLAQVRAWLVAERQVIGHISRFEFFVIAPETVSFSEHIDLAILGSGLEPEVSARLVEQLELREDVAAVYVLLSSKAFSFENLQLYSQSCAEVFNEEKDQLRFLSRLCAARVKNRKSSKGRLCTFFAAKGGVGLTTVVTALAHAAQDRGQTALVVDLSRNSDIACSLSFAKKFSPELSGFLQQRCQLSPQELKTCVQTAENGINIILPPAGGAEIRESWLRSSETLPTTLSLIEAALAIYDYVLVDTAQSEGILPFSLAVRSDERVMVSSNEVDAIYFATQRSSLGAGHLSGRTVNLLINCRSLFGLTAGECLRYARNVTNSEINWKELPAIPCDRSGSFWTGSRNSFFTESSKATRIALSGLLAQLSGEQNIKGQQDYVKDSDRTGYVKQGPITLLLQNFRRIAVRPKLIERASCLMLPHLLQVQSPDPIRGDETGEKLSTITAKTRTDLEMVRELESEKEEKQALAHLTVVADQKKQSVDLLLRPKDLLLSAAPHKANPDAATESVN